MEEKFGALKLLLWSEEGPTIRELLYATLPYISAGSCLLVQCIYELLNNGKMSLDMFCCLYKKLLMSWRLNQTWNYPIWYREFSPLMSNLHSLRVINLHSWSFDELKLEPVVAIKGAYISITRSFYTCLLLQQCNEVVSFFRCHSCCRAISNSPLSSA